MNTINASMGYSGFQLWMGWSPHVLPLLVPTALASTAEIDACNLFSQILADEANAKDSLLIANIAQAFYANKEQGKEDIFKVGDKVMLSTLH